MNERHFVIMNKINDQSLHEDVASSFKEFLESCVNQGICLENAKLTGKDLSETNLESADLRLADLSQANLAGARLNKSDLAGVSFMAANLEDAMLSGSNLVHADFTGANLKGADLSYCNVNGANFTGANMDECNIEGTSFIKALMSHTAQLETKKRKSREKFVYSPIRFLILQIIFFIYQFVGAFFGGPFVVFYWAFTIIVSLVLAVYSSKKWWLGIPIQTAVLFMFVSILIP